MKKEGDRTEDLPYEGVRNRAPGQRWRRHLSTRAAQPALVPMKPWSTFSLRRPRRLKWPWSQLALIQASTHGPKRLSVTAEEEKSSRSTSWGKGPQPGDGGILVLFELLEVLPLRSQDTGERESTTFFPLPTSRRCLVSFPLNFVGLYGWGFVCVLPFNCYWVFKLNFEG